MNYLCRAIWFLICFYQPMPLFANNICLNENSVFDFQTNLSFEVCETVVRSKECQSLKQELEKTDPDALKKLKTCERGGGATLRQEAMRLLQGCMSGAQISISTILHSLEQSAEDWAKDSFLCDDARKKAIFEGAKRDFLKELSIPSDRELAYWSCERIHAYLDRERLIQSTRFDSWAQSLRNAKNLLRSLELKLDCYSPDAQVEMMCISLPLVATGILGRNPGATTSALGRIAKIAGRSQSTLSLSRIKEFNEKILNSIAFNKNAFNRVAKNLTLSPSIKVYDYNGRVFQNEFKPGESYTVNVQGSTLIFGKKLVASDGKVGGKGTHMVLKRLTGDYSEQPPLGGAIRINRDGSIDISGYHHSMESDDAAQAIEGVIRKLVPDGTAIRSTPNRLRTLVP